MKRRQLTAPRTARHDRSRVALRAALLATAAAGALGCSLPQSAPLSFGAHLRDEVAKRLGDEAAAGLDVPFEIDDEIRALVDRRVLSGGSDKRRSDEIIDFVFGWLRLQYALTPTRNAILTFHDREGNCLSFVNLFVGIARYKMLNPFYVEVTDYQRWNYRDGMVVSQGHIVAGMYINGELSTFDFLPYRPKGYRNFKPIDDLTATAHYYNNLGAEALLAGDLTHAEELLNTAARLAPRFVKAINNLGVCRLRRGDLPGALEIYERGLELEPDNVALLTNLARTYQQLGRTEEASALLLRLEDANEVNPFFFVYRGDVALARGDNQAALEYMAKALRLDSEVPEVHIGLAKVYLALGDLPKAKHHVERALRLDATHKEARALAVLLQDKEVTTR